MTTILIVDDSTSIRNMLRATLQPMGYQILEAAGGRAGLEQVKQARIDLVISDVVMPEMDGPTMFGELRKRGVQAKSWGA